MLSVMSDFLNTDARSEEPCALLFGGFDGLHLGHRALLDRAKKSGLPVGITSIFGGKGKELFTKSEREFLFARNGLRFLLEFPFTEAFKETSAEDFLRAIFSRLDVRLAVCGEDFRFGKGAAGTPALLKASAPCPVAVMPVVRSDYMRAETEGARMRKISATVCKKHLKAGEIALLNSCLSGEGVAFCDSAYFVAGTVEHGRQVGRQYGFPTLNLSVPEEKLLPPDGVYGGLAATPAGDFPTVVNIGARPTFGVKERKIEAYLLGFSGDLYGAAVRVYPISFFRPIEKFSSAQALQEQLARDVARLKNDLKVRNV